MKSRPKKEGAEIVLKQLFLFLFFIVSVWAEPTVIIDNGPIKIEDFRVGYFIDKSGKLSLKDIEKQSFEDIDNRFSLGINADITWIRIKLQNDSNEARELFVHNVYTYLSYDTHFYEVLDGKLIGEIEYTLPLNYNTDKMAGAEAVYHLSLDTKQSKTLYLRSHFKAYNIGELGIYDARNSQKNLIDTFVPSIVMVSILLTLALYHIILFFYSKRIEYIYYSLYLISASVFISYTYGALSHYFSVYGNLALKLNAATMLPPIFLSLFVKTIFGTAERFPAYNRILYSFIILFFALWLYSFYSYYQAIELASLLYIYFFIGMLWIVFSLYKKKVPFSGYFLVAHIFYLLFAIIAILFYHGLLYFNFFTVHALGTGTMIEAFMLGLLISYRIKLLEEKNRFYNVQLVIDKMTSLYNKSYFEEVFDEEIAYAQETGEGFALMILDIDYFKQYNDTYGHLEGDKTLVAVSEVLKSTLRRSTDMAFRVGGEEFTVLTEMQVKEAYAMAQKILQDIQGLQIEHRSSAASKYLTVSIGLYIVTGKPHESADEVYRLADNALYSAKEEGRNRVVLARKTS